MSDEPGGAGGAPPADAGAVSAGAPAWARALSAGADPVLIARCVPLLADPAVDAESLRRVLARRLDTGRATDAASVASVLAGTQSEPPVGLEASAQALRDAGAWVHVVGEPGYPR